jgi:hypothetical protein
METLLMDNKGISSKGFRARPERDCLRCGFQAAKTWTTILEAVNTSIARAAEGSAIATQSNGHVSGSVADGARNHAETIQKKLPIAKIVNANPMKNCHFLFGMGNALVAAGQRNAS